MKGFLLRLRANEPKPWMFLRIDSLGEDEVPAVFCQFLRSCGRASE